jgi:hypothetical protein
VSVAAQRYGTPTCQPQHQHQPSRPPQQWQGPEPDGYTLGEIDRLTRTALKGRLPAGLDTTDAYEAAWFAIVEAIYSAAATKQAPPWPGQLVWTARHALDDLLNSEWHHQGYAHQTAHQAARRAPMFERYWAWHAGPVAGPEEAVTSRLALQQIWPLLRGRDREVLVALAYASVAAFSSRLHRARRRVVALWFEHEAPPPARLASRFRATGRPDQVERWRGHDHQRCGCASCTSLRNGNGNGTGKGRVRARRDQGQAASLGQTSGRCA